MKKYPRHFPNTALSGSLIGVLFMAGCASTPEPNPQIVSLQNRYELVASQPFASQEAGEELEATLQALENGREANQEREEEALTHYVTVADTNLDIAEARIRLYETNQQIASSSETREALVLDARERELAISRAEAEAARSAAERKEAELNAQQRELARRESQIQDQQRVLQQKEQQLSEAEARLNATREQAKILAEQLSEVTAKVSDRGTVLVLSDIVFDFDSAELKPGSDSAITRIAGFLAEYRDQKLEIEGHTDSVGSEEYNENLSEERAMSVRNALVEKGIDPARISIEGRGENFPVASNDSSSGRQRNRRVEIILENEIETPVAARF